MFLYHDVENNRAAYYSDLLAIPKNKRSDVVQEARDSIQRYFFGGSSSERYMKDRLTEWEYSRTDDELREMIRSCKDRAAQALEDDLARTRQWLASAFLLKRQAMRPGMPDCYREHNLMCARQWIKTRWPEYKAARKAARGF